MAKNDTYISLKEAAKLSGYSADYIGQLIRKRKLKGKQTYSNVAWVTTVEAIEEYKQADSKRKGATLAFSAHESHQKEILTTVLNIVVVCGAVVAIFSILISLYLFVAGIEHLFDQGVFESTSTP